MGWAKPVNLQGAGSLVRRYCGTRRLKRYIPIATWLPNYKLSYIKNDLIAGLTVGLTLIAQSLAFAQIANLPAQFGLYSSFAGLFVYTFLGTSKDAGLGPSNLLSMLIGQFMLQLNSHNPVYTTLMSLFGGLVLFLMGVMRLGFLVNMFSIPVISGFTSAAGLIIIINQLTNFFGIAGRGETSFKQISHLVRNFTRMNFFDLGIGGIALVFIIIMQRLPSFAAKRSFFFRKGTRAAEVLRVFCASRNVLLVVVGTLFSFLMNLSHPYVNISRIGKLPEGLKLPSLPRFTITNASVFDNTSLTDEPIVEVRSAYQVVFDDLNVSLLVLPFMAMLELVAITKSLGRKNHYRVDHSQELIAVGLANVAGSFFGAFPITVAATRSALNDQCRVSTPLAGSIAAVLVVLAAQFGTPVFYFIPNAVLAAVITSAGISLIDLATVAHIWHEWRWDLIPLAATFIVSMCTQLWMGILVGVSMSLAMLLAPVVRLKIVAEHLSSFPPPEVAVTPKKQTSIGGCGGPGVTNGTAANVSTPFQTPPSIDDAGTTMQRITIVRLQQGLQYPSVDRFTDRMSKILANDDGLIVIDCQFITGLDFTSLQGIRHVLLLASRLNRSVVFARLSDHLRKHIELLDIDHFRHVGRWDDILVEEEAQDDYDKDGSLSSLNGSAYGENNVDGMLAKRLSKNTEDLTPIPEEASEQSIEAVITVATSPTGISHLPQRHSVPVAMNGINAGGTSSVIVVDHHHRTPVSSALKPVASTAPDLESHLAYEPHFFGSAIPLAVGSVSLEDITAETPVRLNGTPRNVSSPHGNLRQGSNDNFARAGHSRHVSFMISDYEDDSDNDSNSDVGISVTTSNSRRRLPKSSAEHVELLEFTTKPSKHGHAAEANCGTAHNDLRLSFRKSNSETKQRSLVATSSHPHLTLENENANGDTWPADVLLSTLARSLSHQNAASTNGSDEVQQGSGSKRPPSIGSASQPLRVSPKSNSSNGTSKEQASANGSSGTFSVVVVHSSTDETVRMDRDKID